MFQIKKLNDNFPLFSTSLCLYSLFNPIKNSKNPKFCGLYENGFTVIDNFLTIEQCHQLITAFDSLESKCAISYGADKRIFGLEKVSAVHKELIADNIYGKEVGETYLGKQLKLTTTLGGKIARSSDGLGSGGGWHRDSFLPQFKIIVYLTDVVDTSGPFQYVNGSNRLKSKIHDAYYRRESLRNPRYNNSYIESLISRQKISISTFTGRAGTAILCDTSGIHRGMPVQRGSRYAVTNYYKTESRIWKRAGDGIIDKLAASTVINSKVNDR